MGFVTKQGLRFYQFDIFNEQPLFHAILTRQGGFSKPPFDSLNTGGTVGDAPDAVIHNHKKIYETFGFDYYSRLDVWQVHGTQIICGDKPRDPHQPHIKADGILTDKPDITLFMRFADCVPILLFDPVKKAIGVVHAGWQGTCQKIAQHAVVKMGLCFGSKPEDILAGIGPSICQACYEVGQDVHQAFIENFGKAGQGFFKNINGRTFLDLWKANEVVLRASGVQQIETAQICTACHLEDWFSYRAENGKTGRFGVLMKLENIDL
jgi:YfiH family protein